VLLNVVMIAIISTSYRDVVEYLTYILTILTTLGCRVIKGLTNMSVA